MIHRYTAPLATILFVFVLLPLIVSANLQATIIDVPIGANLQTAVDSAPAGAILRLAPTGTCGSVVIGKSVALESAGARIVAAAPGIQFSGRSLDLERLGVFQKGVRQMRKLCQ